MKTSLCRLHLEMFRLLSGMRTLHTQHPACPRATHLSSEPTPWVPGSLLWLLQSRVQVRTQRCDCHHGMGSSPGKQSLPPSDPDSDFSKCPGGRAQNCPTF